MSISDMVAWTDDDDQNSLGDVATKQKNSHAPCHVGSIVVAHVDGCLVSRYVSGACLGVSEAFPDALINDEKPARSHICQL